MPPADAPNEEKAWLVVGFCRRFNERFIRPYLSAPRMCKRASNSAPPQRLR